MEVDVLFGHLEGTQIGILAENLNEVFPLQSFYKVPQTQEDISYLTELRGVFIVILKYWSILADIEYFPELTKCPTTGSLFKIDNNLLAFPLTEVHELKKIQERDMSSLRIKKDIKVWQDCMIINPV